MVEMKCKTLSAVSLVVLGGCGITTPIEPASTSQSHFEGAVYSGKTVKLDDPTPGEQSYRLFQQGATGFVSLEAVRSDVEELAENNCKRKGRSMHGVAETDAVPPYILGNFPRVELVFECLPVQASAGGISGQGKYEQLEELKRLLDNGTLTQAEFDREKAKVLNRP
jgi:hypothetical protein